MRSPTRDNPDDPATASVKKNITLSHAFRLSVSTVLDTNDLDLYVLRDANNDGVFAPSEIVASSAGGTANAPCRLQQGDDTRSELQRRAPARPVHGSVRAVVPIKITR